MTWRFPWALSSGRDKLAGTFQAGGSRVRGMLGRFTARMLVERVRRFGCAQLERREIHWPGMRMMQAAPAHHVEGDQPDRQSVQYGLHCRKPSGHRQVRSGMWPKSRRRSEREYPRPGSRYPRLSGKKPFLARELFLGGQCPLSAARKESTDGRTIRRWSFCPVRAAAGVTCRGFQAIMRHRHERLTTGKCSLTHIAADRAKPMAGRRRVWQLAAVPCVGATGIDARVGSWRLREWRNWQTRWT